MGLFAKILALAIPLSMVILTTAQNSYNSKTQICCNGTLTDINDGSGNTNTACCGTKAYDSTKSVCCRNGHTLDRQTENGTYMCCENYDTGAPATELFDPTNQQCCNGAAVDKPNPEQHYQCCDQQLYSWNTQLCCNDEVMNRTADEQCCGGKLLYGYKTHICCATYGFVNENRYGVKEAEIHATNGSNSISCCGLEPYDYSESVCCDKKVQPRESKTTAVADCCNGQQYEYGKQICCSTYDLTSTGELVITASQLHDVSDGSSSCCGLERFNYQDEVCCDGNTTRSKPEGADKYTYMQCCGDQVIDDPRSQICINNKVKDISRPETWLCDKEFDQQTQICCGDEVYDNDSDMACCEQIQQAYNKTTLRVR